MNSPASDNRIPVILLSGFLGSGKTTLLNRLLAHAPRSAVIINEFGSTPIDQQLLREHNMPLSILTGGCLCCQVIGSLTPLLKNLRMAWDARPSDPIHGKPFERIFIETSGIANPEPVLDTLLRERWLSARYRLEGMVTTVSAVNGAEVLSRFPEAQAQVAWADTLVVTQADLVDDQGLARLHTVLDKLSPVAKRLHAVQGVIGSDDPVLFPHRERFRLKTATGRLDHQFNSITLSFDDPLPWERIQAILAMITKLYARSLVRMKGMLYTPDDGRPLIIQGVGGRLYPPQRLPVRAGDDGRGRLVLIFEGEVKLLSEEIMQMIPAIP